MPKLYYLPLVFGYPFVKLCYVVDYSNPTKLSRHLIRMCNHYNIHSWLYSLEHLVHIRIWACSNWRGLTINWSVFDSPTPSLESSSRIGTELTRCYLKHVKKRVFSSFVTVSWPNSKSSLIFSVLAKMAPRIERQVSCVTCSSPKALHGPAAHSEHGKSCVAVRVCCIVLSCRRWAARYLPRPGWAVGCCHTCLGPHVASLLPCRSPSALPQANHARSHRTSLQRHPRIAVGWSHPCRSSGGLEVASCCYKIPCVLLSTSTPAYRSVQRDREERASERKRVQPKFFPNLLLI